MPPPGLGEEGPSLQAQRVTQVGTQFFFFIEELPTPLPPASSLLGSTAQLEVGLGVVPKCRVGRGDLQTAGSTHRICPILPQVPSPDTALGLDSHFPPPTPLPSSANPGRVGTIGSEGA